MLPRIIPADLRSLANQALSLCHSLARHTETPGSITRTFLSAPMHACHAELGHRMRSLGLATSVDAAGNLRGLYAGSDPCARRLLIGSHLDSVPDAGALDGILGVAIALALIEALDRILPFAIEVIAFSEEEGVRFSLPFIGSRALAGALDPAMLLCTDSSGVTIAQAIKNFGLDPDLLPQAALDPTSASAYLEFHIEQGPILDSENLSLAAVSSIAGQTRAAVTFSGFPNHAGTTPMNLRADALAAAAAWIVSVEKYACTTPGLVATVGRIEALPNIANVIAGEVRLTLDVRHAEDPLRHAAAGHLLSLAAAIAESRRLAAAHRILSNQPAAPMHPALIALARRALEATNLPPRTLVSGAGHDAMILSAILPSVMFFLRTPGGVSHHPAETVRPEDVELALRAGLHFLNFFAAQSELYSD